MKRMICALSMPLLFLTACASQSQQAQSQQEQPQQPSVNQLVSPAGMNSSLSRLFTNSDGKVYLSWVEENAETQISRLRYATLEDGHWREPATIASGDNWFVNWADFPSMIADGDRLAAHWLQKRADGKYDYDVKVAFSGDHGQQWGEAMTPHKDGVSAEHGFVSMLPLSGQQTFVTWLDGRYTKSGHGESSHSHGHGGGAMTLRAGIFDSQSNTVDEWELDHRVCDCCQTSAAMTSKGPIVAYRDRSETEIRDISVVRYVDQQWTQPTAVYADHWQIEGCPVNGPAITAADEQVAVAWFTMSGDVAQVKLAVSNDAGATFASPVMISKGKTMGRIAITTLDSGDIAVAWMDQQGATAQINVAKYSPQGVLLNKVVAAETPAARSTGFPSLTAAGENLYLSWTQVGESKQVKTAQVSL